MTIAQRLRNLYDNMVIADSVTNEFVEALPDCYNAVKAKGGTIPAELTAANLPDAIESIPSRGKIYPVNMPNFYSSPANTQEELGENMIDLQGRNLGMYGNQSIFRNCTKVKKIDLSGINGTLGGYLRTWFYGDALLEEVYLNGSCAVDNTGTIDFNIAFYGVRNLRVFRVGNWFTHVANFHWNDNDTAVAMTRETIVDFLNDLGQQDSVNFPAENTITLGAAKLALLSDTDKAIATSKGWTLA